MFCIYEEDVRADDLTTGQREGRLDAVSDVYWFSFFTFGGMRG